MQKQIAKLKRSQTKYWFLSVNLNYVYIVSTLPTDHYAILRDIPSNLKGDLSPLIWYE